MVERIMLFKLSEPARRRELAEHVRAALYDLDGLEELSVGLPADPTSEKSWDLCVVLRFSTLLRQNEALESETFQRLLGVELKGRYEVVKAWSFERMT